MTFKLFRRFDLINLLFLLIGFCGTITLFSASVNLDMDFTKVKTVIIKRLLILLVSYFIMELVSQVYLRFWMSYAYIFYALNILLLLVVAFFGIIGMGAKRWINLYFFDLQPSETMRLILLIALARFVNENNIKLYRNLLVGMVVILLPVFLVLKQPDLGTALMLFSIGFSVLFLSGFPLRLLTGGAVAFCAVLPILWFRLYDYQQKRILVFFNSDLDPLGASYNIKQSLIAISSGGFFGKGFLKGSQVHFNFLPAKQTDFIFSVVCEEFGIIGGVFVLSLYGLLIIMGWNIALKTKDNFGRMLAFGLTNLIFFYVFTNVSMTVGILPVVGVPLPLFSQGGSAIISFACIIGLLKAIKNRQSN